MAQTPRPPHPSVLALEESLAWVRTRTDPSALQHHFIRAHVLLDAAEPAEDPVQPGIGRVAAEAGVQTLVLNHLVPGDGSMGSEAFRQRAQQCFDGTVVLAEDLHRLSLTEPPQKAGDG